MWKKYRFFSIVLIDNWCASKKFEVPDGKPWKTNVYFTIQTGTGVADALRPWCIPTFISWGASVANTEFPRNVQGAVYWTQSNSFA